VIGTIFTVALGSCLWAQPRPFSPSDVWEWREIHDVRIHPEGTQVVYAQQRADRASNAFHSRLWVTRVSGGAPQALTGEGRTDTRPRWSPDGTRIAYISSGPGTAAIFVRRLNSEQEARITVGDGVPLAFAWSPDGGTIAYTARMEETLTGVEWAPPALLPQLRARRVRLFLIGAGGGEARPVPLGNLEPEGEPAWMPDGRSLLLSLSEPFDPAHPLEGPEIYSLRLPDFTLRRLTRHPGPDFDPVPSPDGSRIAWIARDAAAQTYVTSKLWVANADGSRARNLAGALDRDPVQPAWSSDSRTVYFLAQDHGETRVWAARNDGSVRTVLSAAGLHDLSLADNGRAAAVRDPGELIAFPADVAGSPVVLASPNREFLASRKAGAVEAFEYRSGTRTIQAWLTRPPEFDPQKKYPLLLDIDDVPRQMCGGEFRLRAQVFAAAGMLVLCANARGTPGYGEAFGNLIRSGFPGDDFTDWMAGVEAVASRSYVDGTRLAIAGGLSAAWAIGHTDRFHAAVARRPVVDFTLDIATAADGRWRAAAWMGGMPWAEPEQYWKRSPLFSAGQFRTPTLVIAGKHDAAAAELYFALQSRQVDSALVRIGGSPEDLVLEWEALLGWVKR